MTSLQERILSCVEYAISEFNVHEQYLLKNDLSERAICAEFSKYLQSAIIKFGFNEYKTDVEYNRGYGGKEHAIKQLDGHNIVLDLVVHKREYNNIYGFDNLLCIEMKKANNCNDIESDKKRLRKLTNYDYKFNYRAGYMVVIDNINNNCRLYIESSYYLE